MQKDLSELLILLLTWVENLTANPFGAGFEPYTNILGNYFYGIFFGFIGGAVYMGTGNVGSTLVYFLLIGIFMAMVIPSLILLIFGLMTGIIITVILYNTLIAKRSI